MTPENEQKLRELIAEHLGVDIDQVTPEASFINDLGTDSLDLIELVMEAEIEFDIEISDYDAEMILTVGDAIDLLTSMHL